MIDSTSVQQMVDSLKTTHSESGSDWILHHVMDGNYLDFSPIGKIYLPHFELYGLDLSITRHVLFMWIGAALLYLPGPIFPIGPRGRGAARRQNRHRGGGHRRKRRVWLQFE